MNFNALSGRPCRGPAKRWRPSWWVGCFALSAALAASQASPPLLGLLPYNYRPDNVFVYPAKLSPDMRRVAVLPLASQVRGDLPEGCEALAPILWEQLVKTKRFELVVVDPETLRHGTGRLQWSGSETLPPDFFAFLRRQYACDGVLFAEVTAYHAYAPLAVGWRLKLVDARSAQIIWATDELFDSTRPEVYRAAQRFEAAKTLWPFGHDENWLAVSSPRQFGRYSVAALLNTLPGR